jgi:CDP-6-deoxy-D-xylo-4-hexulose-3-dehydrase
MEQTTIFHYPLAASTWDQNELAAMQRVINSGQFSMGKEVSTFEQAFAKWFGATYAVMVNSGSSANLLAIAALFYKQEHPLKPGDEVIVPAVSWSTTYMPLQQYGLKVVFVDVDMHTLNFDLNALEQAITDKTRLIFAVNLLGNANDYERIGKIIGLRDIELVEDNCESMGARYQGHYTGTFGVMGTFSSYFSHHISTMEGGMVVTDDEELYHILLSLRSHGWTRHLPKQNKVTGTKSDNDFEELFRFVLPGYNVRPLELSGAIGKEQLAKLADFVQVRRANAKHLRSLLGKDSCFLMQQEVGESSWFGFSFVIKPGQNIQRAKILAELTRVGVEVRPIVSGNFLKNPALRYFDYRVCGETPNADRVDACGFFIGNHHFDMRDKLERVAGILKGFR